MRTTETYEFKAHFPLCELSVWQEPVGGGGQGPVSSGDMERSAIEIMPGVRPLPYYVCVLVILLVSVECYVAGYEILAAAARFFGAS